MLKILLVYYEPIQSGQTTHVLSLVNGLDHRRYNLSVVLPNHLEKSILLFRRAGVQVYPLPMGKVVWKFGGIIKIIQLLRQERFDIVHVHSQEAGLMMRVLTTITGIKHVIYTPQTVDISRTRWHWLYILLERVFSRVTDRIVSVNEVDRKRLVNWGIPSDKVITIPNGIDLRLCDKAIDKNALRYQLGIIPNQPLIMQVGRLSPQKDPLAFVDGASIVINKYAGVQCMMIGNGPLKDKTQEYIHELGLSENVRLTGWQDNAFELISAADIITLTSQWEGTPFSLLEAMAWSKPVVATEVNGCLEVVEDGVSGFLVRPGDTLDWALHIIELLEKPELAETMGQRGRARVERMFRREVMIN